MEIRAGAPVECLDGPAGTFVCGVIDPLAQRQTHVVVRDRAAGHQQWLVPLSKVRGATATAIRLGCPRAEVSRCEPFIEARFVRVAAEPTGAGGLPSADRYVLWPYAGRSTDALPVAAEGLPEAELPIQRGDEVEATDGPVGHVDEFVIDPTDRRVTHLVVPMGHLWGKQDALIPLSAIARIHDNTVTLTLDRRAIGVLPSLPIRREAELASMMEPATVADLKP
ncbi:MAG: PRC-barrel domain-containing protein, partial [Actinomycetota bacterium]|nr:PRC-barrel domain-containing protein [Actinomycetota bacterium]